MVNLNTKRGYVMRKILAFLLILFIGFVTPVLAENEDSVLPSETGVVQSIENIYSDDNAGQQGTQQIAKVKILSGEYKGEEREIVNILTENPAYDIQLKKGDKVVLHLEEDPTGGMNFFIADLKRDTSMMFFGLIFCVFLVIIGKKKGVFSLISIISTVALILLVMLPLILNGICPIVSAILVGALSTVITIYLVGGFNAKSTSAIIGTMFSLVFAGGLSMLAIYTAHLTGFAGEETVFLYGARPDLSFTGILSASMIIAALGALMDTSVSIASTINEIHQTDESLGVIDLFKSGMNVGRDIIGTMSNTLILVYMGSALPLLLLGSNIDMQKFFNLNQVSTEILSAITGSIAILACVPITAIVAAYLIKKKKNRNVDFNF